LRRAQRRGDYFLYIAEEIWEHGRYEGIRARWGEGADLYLPEILAPRYAGQSAAYSTTGMIEIKPQSVVLFDNTYIRITILSCIVSHFGVFYPRGGGRYLIEIIYLVSLIAFAVIDCKIIQ
jgi:hypothetical protein